MMYHFKENKILKQSQGKFWGILVIIVGLYLLYTKNIEAHTVHSLSVKEAYNYMQEHESDITILDVRSAEEFEDEALLHAKLIPLSLLPKKMQLLDKNKKIMVYCHSGRRSLKAATLLTEKGFKVLNIKGGMSSWIGYGLPYQF